MSEPTAEATTSKPATQERVRLIVNPAAWQAGSDGSSIDRIVALLGAHGLKTEVAIIEGEHDGRKLARAAVRDQVDIVAVAGGDGTVHEVALGLIGTGVPLGIVPLGTMNNVAHMLHIPENLDDACTIVATGKRHPIDVGLVNGQPFLEVVSIGTEAELFPLAEKLRHHGPLAALRASIAGLGVLLRAQQRAMTIETDGRRSATHAWQVSICNGPFYGLHFDAAPGARIDDGKLDLIIARYPQRWGLVRHYLSIMSGERKAPMHVRQQRARRARIYSPTPLPVAADATPIGHTPVTVSVASHALVVLAPPEIAGAAPEPPPSPIEAVLRSIAGSEHHHDPTLFPQDEVVRRMRALALWYWLVAAVAGAAAGIAFWQRRWPFALRESRRGKAMPASQPQERGKIAAVIATTAAFARLRMIPETIGFIASSLLGGIAALGRRIERRNPRFVAPDGATARAVAGTGLLAAGVLATRKPSLRRHALVGALGALGIWLAGFRAAYDNRRQRASVALGAALGALGLGGALGLLAWMRQTIYRSLTPAGADEQLAARQAREVLPGPSRTTAPVAIKMPLERGDIVLVGPDGKPGARIIELLTRSHYHHVAIYDGGGQVIEAMPGGVRRFPLRSPRITGIRPSVLPEQRRAAADWADRQVGSHYDRRGLFLIAFDRLFPGLRLTNVSGDRYSCAVFVADAYLHAGVELLPEHRWQDLVPGDFMALLDGA